MSTHPRRTSNAPGKQVWVELIAFNIDAADLGVKAYLQDLQEPPELISLLLFSAEFLHSHRSADLDARLPTECTSYGARPTSVRGPRQPWTRRQLAELVRRLQEQGIKVLFAVFDLYRYRLDGEFFVGDWNRFHPNQCPTDSNGNRVEGMLNPLRRLENGRLYEDFIADQIGLVLDDYGFDGMHGADGFSSGRLPLWQADFSDDMIDQFTAQSGVVLPAEYRTGSTDPDLIGRRASWIWIHVRLEWIEFHVERWLQFWRKITTVVHARRAIVVLNNAWTRDPFEAVYRYGVDYTRLADLGIDGMVLETPAAAIELLENPGHDPIHAMLASTLLIRMHTPTLPLSALIGLHDTYEQWNVIHHAPAMLERDIRVLTAASAYDGATQQRCVNAFLWCLADGLEASEWMRLDALRLSCDSIAPTTIGAVTLLYSPDVMAAELRSFQAQRSASTHTLLTQLLRAGADLTTIARPDDPLDPSTTVLILKPELYPPAVIATAISRYREVILIGCDPEEPQRWNFLRYRNHEQVNNQFIGAAVANDVVMEESVAKASWLYDLPMHIMSDEFLARCVTEINSSAGAAPGSETDPHVQTLTVHQSESAALLIFLNRDHGYHDYQTSTTSAVISAEPVSVSAPIGMARLSEGKLSVRVPPKGVAVFQVEFSHESEAASAH